MWSQLNESFPLCLYIVVDCFRPGRYLWRKVCFFPSLSFFRRPPTARSKWLFRTSVYAGLLLGFSHLLAGKNTTYATTMVDLVLVANTLCNRALAGPTAPFWIWSSSFTQTLISSFGCLVKVILLCFFGFLFLFCATVGTDSIENFGWEVLANWVFRKWNMKLLTCHCLHI